MNFQKYGLYRPSSWSLLSNEALHSFIGLVNPDGVGFSSIGYFLLLLLATVLFQNSSKELSKQMIGMTHHNTFKCQQIKGQLP